MSTAQEQTSVVEAGTREISYAEAIAEALRTEMRLDPRVFVMGEDVGNFGGLFGGTKGLLDEFGPERVRDTPISEAALIGAGVGAAITGMRPMVEIQFMDFTACAMDQIVNQAAKIRFMLGGKAEVPLVIRTPYGTGLKLASQHSQSLEAWFAHVPGLLVAIPSTPADAKGLLVTALRDQNPIIFLEHKLLYPTRGPVPEEQYTIPFGQADVKRSGKRRHDRGHRAHGAAIARRGRRAGRRRDRGRGGGSPDAGPAGQGRDHRLGQEDRPTGGRPRGGEARRLRRGDRLPHRRGGVRLSGRPDQAGGREETSPSRSTRRWKRRLCPRQRTSPPPRDR